MSASRAEAPEFVELDPETHPWDRVYTVSPLVVVGTREPPGYDLAPKHMAMPLGWSGWFGFVCTPEHATYRNARREGAFTVSYPRPGGVVETALTAAPRGEGRAPELGSLPTLPALRIDGFVLEDSHLALECRVERVVDGFGEASLVAGRVLVARARAEALRVSDRDDQEVLRAVPLLAFLAPDRFTSVSRGVPFPYPAGFRG